MKIDHVTRRFTETAWGGTESMVLQCCRELRRRGHACRIVTTKALDDASEAEMAGVPVRRFRYSYPYLGLSHAAKDQLDLRAGNLFSFSLLGHLMLQGDADLYHLHTGKRLGGIVRSVAAMQRKRYVVTLHGGAVDIPQDEQAGLTAVTGSAWEWGKALGALVGARRVLEDAAAVLCVNRSEQEKLQEKYPGKRVVWTPNGVDTKLFASGDGKRFREAHAVPGGAKVLLHVGRIDPQKNQMEAVEVFDRVAAVLKDTWLLLAGATTDKEYEARVMERIRQSAARSRILCLGNVTPGSQSLADLYASADLLLMTSRHEPFGIVILEAWAAGLPVVSSRVGGIPYFVEHGRNGLLYELGDVPTATDHVVGVLQQTNIREELRKQGRTEVERYSFQRTTEQLISIYEEAHGEHSVRA